VGGIRLVRRCGPTHALGLAALLPWLVAAAPTPADRAIATAEGHVSAAPGRPAAYVELATAFMQKSREASDPGYYPRAAAALERALRLDPQNYEALRVRPWVLLGQHDFRGARVAAEQARALESDDWWNYGMLADAEVELGDYAAADRVVQRMLDLRPGLPAYTRAAFLRTLYGDRAGAIEMLTLALATTSPGDPETFAWTLVHLGHEHFARGEMVHAADAYAQALDALPGYYLALAGLARVRAAEGRTAEAVDLYQRAVSRVPAPDLVAALGDVLAAKGMVGDAERQYALVEYIGRVAQATGTTYGRQLALFYADHDRRLDEALRLAEQEAAVRDDIYTDDTLAWACYKNGRLAQAKRAASRAQRLGTEDALLDYHAGLIAAAFGRPRAGRRHLRRALAMNPHFDLHEAPRAEAALAALEEPARFVRAVAEDAP